MNVTITITTDNGPDVTIERSRREGSTHITAEVDLKALDVLLDTATSEARAAYGIESIDAADAAAKAEAYRLAKAQRDSESGLPGLSDEQSCDLLSQPKPKTFVRPTATTPPATRTPTEKEV